MVSKKSIRDLTVQELHQKRVLVRVDFNVPMQDGVISDDARILAALPTLRYLVEHGAIVIVASHMGRPKGEKNLDYSLRPISERLAELMGVGVHFIDDCIGADVQSQIKELEAGQVVVLENVRFYEEETKNDPQFARSLSGVADLFVMDAFGAAHRAHASTAGIAAYIPAYAGFLIEKELSFLENAVKKPDRPFVAIIGGAKVSTKLQVLTQLAASVDVLIIGGGMTYTFMKAMGFEIGNSLCEDAYLPQAKAFLDESKNSETQVLFPVDHVVAEAFDVNASSQVVDNESFPAQGIGVDIGPKTTALIQDALSTAKTVLWNGPLGVFEMDPFAKGTLSVAQTMADLDAVTIIGGGDSAAAALKAGVADQMSHISTGGGACLEFLEGKELPGISVLEES